MAFCALTIPAERSLLVEERFAAGVDARAIQRILRLLEVQLHAAMADCAGVHAGSARRAPRGVAQRREGYQSARIDGPEGNTGADGGVDGRVQLRLVVDAVELMPLAK